MKLTTFLEEGIKKDILEEAYINDCGEMAVDCDEVERILNYYLEKFADYRIINVSEANNPEEDK